jgi:hypothetical protein
MREHIPNAVGGALLTNAVVHEQRHPERRREGATRTTAHRDLVVAERCGVTCPHLATVQSQSDECAHIHPELTLSHRSTLAAGVLSAALLLTAATACSSDSGSDSNDEDIEGVQTDDQGSPTAEGSETPAPDPEPTDDGIDRPEIELPEDLELIVEETETGDPVEEAILYDHEQRVATKYESMAEQSLETPALSFYTTGDALTQLFSTLEEIIDGGTYAEGTARYFNQDVTVFDENRAALSYCRDASEIRDVDAETGEVVSESDPNELPTLYETEVVRNEEGVWQETTYDVVSEAEECQ